MQEIKADYINPFIMSAVAILNQVCQLNVKMGKPYIKQANYEEETVTINIGITGEIKGQTIMAFPKAVACFVASRMMMMPVTELDDISKSAISELGNMIMGNAATIFSTKQIGIDITPPVMIIGSVEISTVTSNVCIPIHLDERNSMEINVSLKV